MSVITHEHPHTNALLSSIKVTNLSRRCFFLRDTLAVKLHFCAKAAKAFPLKNYLPVSKLSEVVESIGSNAPRVHLERTVLDDNLLFCT